MQVHLRQPAMQPLAPALRKSIIQAVYPIIDVYPISGRNVSTSVLTLYGGYEFPGANWKPAIAVGLGLYTTQ